jgi:hypothetical protein
MAIGLENTFTGIALQLPCFFERILDRSRVAGGEVGDNRHVPGPPSRDAEGRGMLSQYQVAVIEIGPDDDVLVVELTGNQPAVIPPLGEPFARGAAHAGQATGQAGHLVDLHERTAGFLLKRRSRSAPSRSRGRR